jgi:hypothetical protein
MEIVDCGNRSTVLERFPSLRNDWENLVPWASLQPIAEHDLANIHTV